MKKKFIGTVAILCATVISAVPAFFLLPDTVAVQWSFTGEPQNYLPKYTALAVGLGFGAFGAWYWHKKDRSSLAGANKRIMQVLDLLVGCIGIILLLSFLIINNIN